MLERVEGDARAERIAAAVAGRSANVQDSRARMDEALAAEPVAAHLSNEQVELRRALGVL